MPTESPSFNKLNLLQGHQILPVAELDDLEGVSVLRKTRALF